MTRPVAAETRDGRAAEVVVMDAKAGTLRLTNRELALLTDLVIDPAAAAPELDRERSRLQAAGALDGARPAPFVKSLIDTIARPQLRLMIELSRGDGAGACLAWGTSDQVVLGVPDEERDEPGFALSALEPAALPLTLMSLAGMGRRPVPLQGSILEVRRADLDEAGAAVQSGDRARLDAVLTRAVAEEAGRNDLAVLLAKRIGSWRLSAVWADEAGERHAGELTVIDAGEAGLWRCELPAGVDRLDPDLRLTLTPVAPSRVFALVLGLLPFRSRGDATALERP